jgi:hypothetical protein
LKNSCRAASALFQKLVLVVVLVLVLEDIGKIEDEDEARVRNPVASRPMPIRERRGFFNNLFPKFPLHLTSNPGLSQNRCTRWPGLRRRPAALQSARFSVSWSAVGLDRIDSQDRF